MTADHLFPILESEADSELLVQVVSKLVVADVPERVIDGIHLGRLTALSKPDGGVRGIVAADIVRRLWPEPSRNSLPRDQRWPPYLSSTPFRRRRVANVSHTSCRPSPTKTPTPQS